MAVNGWGLILIVDLVVAVGLRGACVLETGCRGGEQLRRVVSGTYSVMSMSRLKGICMVDPDAHIAGAECLYRSKLLG